MTELDKVYEERNRVIALLSRLFPSKIVLSPEEKDWHIIYVDTAQGQLSWHFHDREKHLFEGIPTGEVKWDGHDTDEKYRRIALLVKDADDAMAQIVMANKYDA